MTTNVWIENLGCPKNEVDGESIEVILQEEGFHITRNEIQADILILNTCGFIQPAKEESLEELFKLVALKSRYRNKKIIVCGCLAQRYPHELWSKIPEVDAVVGIGEIDKLPLVCSTLLSGERVLKVGTPHRDDGIRRMRRNPKGSPFAYIKIADGCDNRCSYCAIPGIRGGFRSKRSTNILREARQLSEQGVKEIILVAQDTTLYGTDLYGETRLPQLLSSLSRIPELEWIRLLYTHPAHFTDELIEQIATNPKVCKYVDLPLQHISDEILTKMNRKVTRKKVEQLIMSLREKIPAVSLRSSFIVGFPGEKKRHFEELLEFVEAVKFDKLGAFAYWREEGTNAWGFKGQVASHVKQTRLDQLMLIQQRIAFEKNREKIGRTLSVLIDAPPEDGDRLFVGRSQAEAPEVDGMILVKASELKPGLFVQARVVDHRGYDLVAETIEEVKHGRAKRRMRQAGKGSHWNAGS
jgi:ribosomal protein S12 methylthiotransferase